MNLLSFKQIIITWALMLIFILVPDSTFATSDEEQIKLAFQDLAKKHVEGYKEDPRILVYDISAFSPGVQADWRKSKCVVTGDYTYDIQKTDSSTKPYTAFLIYQMYTYVTPAQPTKEIAEKCDTYEENKKPGVYRISFYYQNGKWIPEKYESQMQVERSLAPFWFPHAQDLKHTQFKRLVVKI